MKRLAKIGGVLFLVVILLVGMGVTYLELAYPNVGPARDLKVTATPAMIKRGEYLSNHVVGCIECHSKRDWTRYSGPVIPGTEGQGGELFGHRDGLPGSFYAKNITPAGIAHWSDGELYRLITTGVTQNGEPIFPIMSYPSYGKMDPKDAAAVIVYIRSLHSITNSVPASKADFPVNLIERTIPQPATPVAAPDTSNYVAYGKYLVTLASCSDCHTPMIKGKYDMSRYLAGGNSFILESGQEVRSCNITPDTLSGIGIWSEEMFIKMFKRFDRPYDQIPQISGNQPNTIMPWAAFAGMSVHDLKAMYAYLRTVKPERNVVEKFPEVLVAKK